MNLPPESQLLRIFIGESDKHGHLPLYEVIVQEARRQGMAGATVTRGIMGFGKSSRIHTAKILRISEDLSLTIELVDAPERIERFLPFLEEVVEEGLVTVEQVRVVLYRHEDAPLSAGRSGADKL